MSRSTRLVSTINRATIGPLAKCHPNGVSLLRRADSGPWLDDGWAKVQPAVVLILKRLRKRRHCLKSQPTDWEKPGIKPGPLAYKTYAIGYVILLFVVVFLGYNSQFWPSVLCFCGFMYRRRNACLWPCSLAVPVLAGWVYGFVVGALEGSGSGFKASQKTGLRLKVSSNRLGEAGNRTCDPWFTRHRFIPYTKADT